MMANRQGMVAGQLGRPQRGRSSSKPSNMGRSARGSVIGRHTQAARPQGNHASEQGNCGLREERSRGLGCITTQNEGVCEARIVLCRERKTLERVERPHVSNSGLVHGCANRGQRGTAGSAHRDMVRGHLRRWEHYGGCALTGGCEGQRGGEVRGRAWGHKGRHGGGRISGSGGNKGRRIDSMCCRAGCARCLSLALFMHEATPCSIGTESALCVGLAELGLVLLVPGQRANISLTMSKAALQTVATIASLCEALAGLCLVQRDAGICDMRRPTS